MRVALDEIIQGYGAHDVLRQTTGLEAVPHVAPHVIESSPRGKGSEAERRCLTGSAGFRKGSGWIDRGR